MNFWKHLSREFHRGDELNLTPDEIAKWGDFQEQLDTINGNFCSQTGQEFLRMLPKVLRKPIGLANESYPHIPIWRIAFHMKAYKEKAAEIHRLETEGVTQIFIGRHLGIAVTQATIIEDELKIPHQPQIQPLIFFETGCVGFFNTYDEYFFVTPATLDYDSHRL